MCYPAHTRQYTSLLYNTWSQGALCWPRWGCQTLADRQSEQNNNKSPLLFCLFPFPQFTCKKIGTSVAVPVFVYLHGISQLTWMWKWKEILKRESDGERERERSGKQKKREKYNWTIPCTAAHKTRIHTNIHCSTSWTLFLLA